MVCLPVNNKTLCSRFIKVVGGSPLRLCPGSSIWYCAYTASLVGWVFVRFEERFILTAVRISPDLRLHREWYVSVMATRLLILSGESFAASERAVLQAAPCTTRFNFDRKQFIVLAWHIRVFNLVRNHIRTMLRAVPVLPCMLFVSRNLVSFNELKQIANQHLCEIATHDLRNIGYTSISQIAFSIEVIELDMPVKLIISNVMPPHMQSPPLKSVVIHNTFNTKASGNSPVDSERRLPRQAIQ